MRRRRDIPADPVRTTSETVDAVEDLLRGTLPSVDATEITTAVGALREFAAYLVPGEHLSRAPVTLVAGALACDIYTLHGEDALGIEDPAPPPGAASEIAWKLYVPVPDKAPFTADEVEAADPHLRGGEAPAGAGTGATSAAVSLADLVDAEGLRGGSARR